MGKIKIDLEKIKNSLFLKKSLYFLPRFIIIIYILFISLFALDVFNENYNFWELLVATFIHLLPAITISFFAIFAWKKNTKGGIALLILGLIFTFFFQSYHHLSSFLLISAPLFITGTLFFIQGRTKND